MGLNVRMVGVSSYQQGHNNGREFAKAVGICVSGEHRRVTSETSGAAGDHL